MSSREKGRGSAASEEAGTPVPRLGFVVLHVADLAASTAFYGQALGLPVRIRRRGFIEFATPGANLALQQVGGEGATGGAQGGATRGAGDGATRGAELVLVVEDVERAVAGLAARGLALEGPPEDQPWEGGVRTALVRDPDGNAVRLLQLLRSARGGGPGRAAEDAGSAAGHGLAHVRVVAGSVVEAEADAIVNAANTELRHGGGVAAAISRAAGPDLERASREAAPCPLGRAVATPAGRLRARWVIHVPTVDYRAGRSATPAEITAGTAAALDICRREGLRRVAFPLLGAGIAGTSPRQALLAMMEAFAAHPGLEIAVYAFSAADRRAAEDVLGDGGGG